MDWSSILQIIKACDIISLTQAAEHTWYLLAVIFWHLQLLLVMVSKKDCVHMYTDIF